MDDAFLFNFDRDKNPEKYGGAVGATIVLGESGEIIVNKVSQEEQKQLEEKRKQEKSANDAFWEERKRLEVQEVFDNAKRKQKEILPEQSRTKEKTSKKREGVESLVDVKESIFSYKITDLFLCKGVWHVKGTKSRKVYYPCAVVPKEGILLQKIDESKFNDSRTKNMWRLGMKQPSQDGFKYVEHNDCIPYNPMDAKVKKILEEQTVESKTFAALFKRKMRLAEYTKALEEIDTIYRKNMKELKSYIVDGEDLDDDSESDDGIVASEPRGARRQVNRATTRVSTHKRKLNAGDHIMYMDTLEGTAGSAKALRKTRILQILKDGSIKLENKQEYIFTQDPTLKITVVRGHGSKKDRKKQIACSFDSYTRVPSKMENMEAIIKERDDRSRSIYLDTRAKVTAYAKEGLLDCSSVNSDFSQSTQPESEGILKNTGQKKRQMPGKSVVQSAKKVKKRRKM